MFRKTDTPPPLNRCTEMVVSSEELRLPALSSLVHIHNSPLAHPVSSQRSMVRRIFPPQSPHQPPGDRLNRFNGLIDLIFKKQGRLGKAR